MKYGASLRNRQIIAKLDKGEDLIGTLKTFLTHEHIKSCVFTGHGYFSKCQLQALDPERKTMKTIFSTDAFTAVPSITGNITMLGGEIIVNTACMLNYSAFGQIHTIGGFIQDARVFAVELQFTIFEDLKITRAMDSITGLVTIARIQNLYDSDYTSGIMVSSADSNLGFSSDMSMVSDADSSMMAGISGLTQAGIFSAPPQPAVVRRRTIRTAGGNPSDSAPGINLSSPLGAINAPSQDDSAALPEIPPPPISQSRIEPIENGSANVKRRRRSTAVSSPPASADPNENISPTPAASAASDNPPQTPPANKRHRAQNLAAMPVKQEASHDLIAGDIIFHPTLGKCTINKLLPGNCLEIHAEGGSNHDISMNYFKAVSVTPQDGTRSFRLERL